MHARDTPAIAYVQSLALFLWTFGDSIAVAVLLNLFCYLGSMWIVAAWARRARVSRNVALFTISVLSFSPSAILWALQPMKEAFFQCVLVAVFAAAFRWQRALRTGRLRSVLAASVAVLATLFLLAGTRWYVAVAVLAGCVPFVAVALWTTRRRLAMWLVVVPLLVLGARAVAFSGGSFVLPSIRSALLLDRDGVRELPVVLPWIMPQVRDALVSLGGGTTISTPHGPPQSHAGRFASGALAAFVPHFVLTRLGLLDMGGGRGLWLFADADTLFFDAACLAAIVLCFRRRSASPVFWLILTTTVLTGLALLYVVPNFGTLIRLRLVLLTGCALLPLAWRSGPEKVRAQIFDPPNADDVDVGVDLGGIRLRNDYATEPESGGFTRAKIGL